MAVEASNQSSANPEDAFDIAMARAGLTVPADRRAALVAGANDLQVRAKLLRQPRDASAEPATVFVVRPRSIA